MAAMSPNRSNGKTEPLQELSSSYVAFCVPRWRCALAGFIHARGANAADDWGGKRELAEETSSAIIQIAVVLKATESPLAVFSIARDASV